MISLKSPSRVASKGSYLLSAGILVGLSIFFYALSFHSPAFLHLELGPHGLDPVVDHGWPVRPNDTVARSPCLGPRGELLHKSEDDQLRPLKIENATYPEPMSGSYKALGIEQTWFSADGRYGPYGFGEEEEGYNRSRVDWGSVRWGALQDQCAEANSFRILSLFNYTNKAQFTYRPKDWEKQNRHNGFSKAKVAYRPAEVKTGRQAIVIRTWHTYPYTPDDMQNIRSIITEAALAKNGDYAVFLLVDVKDLSLNIHSDPTSYAAELHRAVPEEFRDIAVLFDKSIQESWYPKVDEYEPLLQIMQPFQLFAHFYPEFDHYWQIEMDTRFMGHTGDMLAAFDKFGRDQPRKQARERASWNYMPRSHGNYTNFTETLGATMETGEASGIWGPVLIGKEIIPIGPSPPTVDPKDDNYQWGVGEDADYLLASPLQEVQRQEDWIFSDYHFGFTLNSTLPWWMSAPAQGRASWNLLNAIHHAQAMQGLKVHSEATLASFALWHGLKISGLPLPIYQDPARDPGEVEFVSNGGPLTRFSDGIAMGGAKYRGATVGFFTGGQTWDWTSPTPDRIMRYWKDEEKAEDDVKMPAMLIQHGGEVLAPNMLMHPRKTNHWKSDADKALGGS